MLAYSNGGVHEVKSKSGRTFPYSSDLDVSYCTVCMSHRLGRSTSAYVTFCFAKRAIQHAVMQLQPKTHGLISDALVCFLSRKIKRNIQEIPNSYGTADWSPPGQESVVMSFRYLPFLR
jgi:hypothetical protein